MAIFEEVRLEWAGKEYVIPAEQVMRAIAKVEDVLSVVDISRQITTGDFKYAKVAGAYGALLRHAGAKVTDEEVYVGIFPRKDAQMVVQVGAALSTLLALIMPPASFKTDESAKKPEPQATAA